MLRKRIYARLITMWRRSKGREGRWENASRDFWWISSLTWDWRRLVREDFCSIGKEKLWKGAQHSRTSIDERIAWII